MSGINKVLTNVRQNLSKEHQAIARENIGAFGAEFVEDCIYIDPLNGDDGNNGLTKSTPVKTILKLTELLRSTEFCKVFLCKFSVSDFIESNGGQLPNLELFNGLTDYDTMAVANVDDTIQYANNNISFYSDCDYLIVSFGPSEDTGNIPEFQGKYISNVVINAPRVIKITGKWNSHITSEETARLVVNQGNADKLSGSVTFTDMRLKPTGTLDSEDNDVAFSNFEAYVNSQGDIKGAIRLLESNGYFDDDTSWVNKISYKSESEVRNVLLTYCNNFDLDCKVINDVNVKARLNVNIVAETCIDGTPSLIFPKLGTTKNCCNLNIRSKGTPSLDKFLLLSLIEPYSSRGQADPIFECSPKINVYWQGTVRLAANRVCASEFTLDCLDTVGNTRLRIDRYAGYDDNEQLIPNTKKVTIHTKGTFRPGTIYTPNTIESLDIKCRDLIWYPDTLVTQYIYAQNLVINAEGAVEDVYLCPGYTTSTENLDTTNESKFTIRSRSFSMPSGHHGGGYNSILDVETEYVNGLAETTHKEVYIKCREFSGGWRNYMRKLTLNAEVVRLTNNGHRPFDFTIIQGSGWNSGGDSNSTININELVFVENITPDGLFSIDSNDYDVIQNVSVNIKVIKCSLDWDEEHLYCPLIGTTIKFKGVISGEIGTIINTLNGEVIPVPRSKSMLFWEPLSADDSNKLRYSSFPDGIISLKLLNFTNQFDFFIDPYQGDDKCDGLTTGTAVKSAAGLLRAFKQSYGMIFQEQELGEEDHYAVAIGDVKLHVLSPKDNRKSIVEAYDEDPLEADFDFWEIPYDGKYYTIIFFGNLEVVADGPNISSIISSLIVEMGNLSISGFTDLELRNCINIGSEYLILGSTNINIRGNLYLNNNYNGIDLIDFGSERFNPTIISCNHVILNARFSDLVVNASGQCMIETPTPNPNSLEDVGDDKGIWDETAFISAAEIRMGLDEPVAIEGETVLKANFVNAYCGSVVDRFSMHCEVFIGTIGTNNYDAYLIIQATDFVRFVYDYENEVYSFDGLVDNIQSDFAYSIIIDSPYISGDIAPLYGCNVSINCVECSSSLYLLGDSKTQVNINGNFCDLVDLYGHDSVIINVNKVNIYLSNFDYFKEDILPSELTDDISSGDETEYIIHSDTAVICLNYGAVDGDLIDPITEPIIKGMISEGTISWENDPSEYNSIPFGAVSLVIGHAFGEQLDYYPSNWDWDIIVLDDEGELIAGPGVTLIPDEFKQLAIASAMPLESTEVEVLLTEGVCSIEPHKCTFIDGITTDVNELYIMVESGGVRSRSGNADIRFLSEAKFAFEVPTGVQLDKVTVSIYGNVCPLNGPASYTPGKLYLGRVVENLVTIEEYDPVVMNITDMLQVYLGQDDAVIKMISDTIAPDTYSEVELDMDGTTTTFDVEGFFLVLKDEDLAAYNAATNVTATVTIDEDTFGPFTIKPVQPLS